MQTLTLQATQPMERTRDPRLASPLGVSHQQTHAVGQINTALMELNQKVPHFAVHKSLYPLYAATSVHLREGVSSGQRKLSDCKSALPWTCAEIHQPLVHFHRSCVCYFHWGLVKTCMKCSSAEAMTFVLLCFRRPCNLFKDEHLDRLKPCSAMLICLLLKNAPPCLWNHSEKRKEMRSGIVQQRSLQKHFSTCPKNQPSLLWFFHTIHRLSLCSCIYFPSLFSSVSSTIYS